jgi:group I intron endonuclease
MGFIYAIGCNITNKIYIGQTKNTIEYRWKSHVYRAKYEKHDYVKKSCTKFYNAINKYGPENFRVVKLAEVPDDQLDYAEKKYITEFDTIKLGYNIKPGGASAGHSDETRKIMSEKIKEVRKNDFKKFRKHTILDGLPQHCNYKTYKGCKQLVITNHPLCKSKKFSNTKYGTIEKAKEALLEYYSQLEKGIIPEELNKYELPKNIYKVKKGYYVKIRVYDKRFEKFFTDTIPDEQNKANAIEYLAEAKAKLKEYKNNHSNNFNINK